MGSDFLTNKQLQTALEQNPELITWSSLREVILHRGKTGKLGFKVHTFKGDSQTYTVITKVKEDCQVWRGHIRACDRIICINNVDICRDDGDRALRLLTGSSGPYVKLFVCQPDRIRVVSSGRSLEHGDSLGISFGNLHVPLGISGTKASDANVSLNAVEHKVNDSSNKDTRNKVNDNLNKDIRSKLNNSFDKDKRNKTEQLNKKQSKNIALNVDTGNKPEYIDAKGFSAVLQEKNKLNDLSKVGPNTHSEACETNNFSLVPNIASVNSQSSQNTCSTNPSSDFGSFQSWSYNKFNSDSSNEGKCNSELVDNIVRASNIYTDSVRGSREVSCGIRLNRNPSGGSLSNSLKSQNDVSYSLKSNCSLLSRHSGQSRDSMGKSKGEKIVRKFYKGNSQDSNEGAEELEPLRLGDSGRHHGKGKVDSRYSHINDDERTQLSIPFITKEVALSVQDIMFDESSQTVPFATEPSYVNNCPCATCTVISGICQNCGNKPGSNVRRSPSDMVSLVPETPDGLLPENYVPLLLEKPHLALWDHKTRVVTIDRGSATEFPFTPKVKVAKNPDASVEIYTLVKSLVKGGPACEKLNVGDWIRSVNGTPIQLPTDVSSLLSNNNKDTSLRLVIQRPVGFSQQSGTSPSPPCHGDKPPQDLTPKPPQELTPTSPLPSPVFSIGSSKELKEPLLPYTHLPGRIESQKSSGQMDKKEPRKIYIQNINKEESDSWNTPFPKVVKFPKVRMFVCGSEAEKCTSLLLQGSEISCDNVRQGYGYIDCSMATNSYGSVVISPSCSNLYATSLSLSNMSVSSMNQSESSSGEKEGIKCKHCGNEYHCSGSHSFAGTVANVELFVVSDEKFFQNCCTYLFTKYSIFILTFDSAKLLRSAPVEIAKMQSLSHTIRSFAGYDCHIMSCGLLNSGSESKNIADEVRTLFYTSSVSMLQIFNVMGPPELIDVGCNSASSDSLNGSRQLQSSVWKIVTETIQRQHILQPCLIILDHLNSIRDHELILTELQMMEIVKTRLPQYQQDVHQMVVTELSMCGEIVSGKAAPITLSHLQKVEYLVLIDPKVMAERLHSAVSAIADDRQRWAKVHSYGLIEIQEFLKPCCLGNGSGNPQIADFMESYGLIFHYLPGQSQLREYFLPYFAISGGTSENIVVDKKDHVLYLQFKRIHGSTQLFFHLLFNIAARSDSGSFSIQTVNCCSFRYHGFSCTSLHQKLDDRIMFVFTREDKAKSLKLPDLYTWLLSLCQRTLAQDIQYVLGAPCPLGEACRTSTAPGIHIVDLEENKHQYCGRERIDLMKPLRAWKPKSQEVEKMTISQQQKNKKPVLINDLNYTKLDRIYQLLRINGDLGRDWKGLAGLIGMTGTDVAIYETYPNPPKELLTSWGCKEQATVEDLIGHLEKLERDDILSVIQSNMVTPPSVLVTPPLDVRTKQENLPSNVL